jgi:hypothetical protein
VITMNRQLLSGAPEDVRRTMEDLARADEQDGGGRGGIRAESELAPVPGLDVGEFGLGRYGAANRMRNSGCP